MTFYSGFSLMQFCILRFPGQYFSYSFPDNMIWLDNTLDDTIFWWYALFPSSQDDCINEIPLYLFLVYICSTFS